MFEVGRDTACRELPLRLLSEKEEIVERISI